MKCGASRKSGCSPSLCEAIRKAECRGEAQRRRAARGLRDRLKMRVQGLFLRRRSLERRRYQGVLALSLAALLGCAHATTVQAKEPALPKATVTKEAVAAA